MNEQPDTAGGVLAYEDVVRQFAMEDLLAGLSGNLVDGINACVECCDRHVDGDRLALLSISAQGAEHRISFAQLRERARQVAKLLVASGIGPGDTVAGLLPRTPELVATILGTFLAGAVYQPLFTAFGPKAIAHRLGISGAGLIVTDSANRAKLDDIDDCPRIATVLAPGEQARSGDIDFIREMARQAGTFAPVMRRGDDLFLMMATSGTTGLPKGVGVPLKALPAFAAYMRWAIDLREGDVFWNLADPGWAYGLYYGIIGPLLLGQATTLYEGGFTARSAIDLIGRCGITNLAGAPTAFRLLIAEGPEAASVIKGRLRVVSSAGEPLNPEVIRWFAQNFGVTIHDHYGQTETGMVVNNHHGLRHAVRVGSAGLAMPGFRVAVLDGLGRELGASQAGTLAVDIARSPLMWFDGYWQHDTQSIRDGYYRTGDTVEAEPDGSISFIGREDDVITSSGYRIGPFDVESALMEHPAVMEVGVIGVPDPERTELVKAFIVLNRGHAPSANLREVLSRHVKSRLSAHAYPRLIDFVDELPKTPSGKIQRFLLRALPNQEQT